MSEENAKKSFTVKGFFKSTSFKCIIVLLAIVLVSGILLTICNSLFYVSDQERLDRVISEIYGEQVTTEEVELDELQTSYQRGTINSAYLVTDDGNYLINSSGTGGYGGSVTCWVVIEMTDGAVSGIGKVVVDSAPGETFLNYIPDEAFDKFGEDYTDGGEFSYSDWANAGVTGGASYTTTAIINSVNTALQFARSQLGGEALPENPLAGYEYTQYIDSEATFFEVDGTDVHYSVKTSGATYNPFVIEITVGEGGVIKEFEINKNGSSVMPDKDYSEDMNKDILNGSLFVGKDADDILAILDGKLEYVNGAFDNTILVGATQSNFTCTYAALFAAANYEAVLAAQGGAQ